MQIISYNPNQYLGSSQNNRTNTKMSTPSDTNRLMQYDTLELTAKGQEEVKAYDTYTIQSVNAKYEIAMNSTVPNYEVYNTWFEELGVLADQRLRDSIDAIQAQKESTEGISEDFITQLYQEQLNWFSEQRDELISQLYNNNSITDEELSFYMNISTDLLGTMDWDMLSVIDEFMSNDVEPLISYANGFSTYLQSGKSLSDSIASYIGEFQKELKRKYGTISQDLTNQYSKDFEQWSQQLKSQLLENINNSSAPLFTKELFLSEMENTFDMIMPDVWESMVNSIEMKNRKFQNDTRLSLQAIEIAKFNNFQVDYKTGYNSNTIRLSTTKPTLFEHSTKFVVEGSYGRTKNLFISFKSESLKVEFEKRIKEAGLEGKKISSKKLEEILKELKKSIKDISEMDLNSIQRKLDQGETEAKFEVNIKKFLNYLNRAVL